MDQELSSVFLRLGVALALGLLVGLQRERVHAAIAGFRTFPLVTLLGSVSCILALELGAIVLGLAFVALAALIVAGNLLGARQDQVDPGMTTEVALLLMFGTGALLVVGPMTLAIALGGGTAVLLHLKGELHGLAGQLTDRDARAIMQFVVISLIVLPVLPDRIYGPYDVLNPRQIWWMVVLIVGVSLVAYLAFKWMRPGAGQLLGGVLGGLVSSTATTVSFARQGSRSAASANVAAIVIVIAAAVVFVRVLIEIAVVAPGSLPVMGPPILILMGVMAAGGLLLWRRERKSSLEPPELSNPTELWSAFGFAALYAVVLLAVAAMKEFFGLAGIYAVAVVSGLTDMDAITLSTAQMVQADRLPASSGWRAIVVAAISNLVFKGGVVGVLGGRRLLAMVAAVFAASLVIGLLMVFFWPV